MAPAPPGGAREENVVQVIVNLIGSTTTTQGLHIQASLDMADYPTGIKVRDEELESLNLKRDDFHGEWNYMLLPK